MKKFLLCMMLAGLMMPAIAQEKMAKEARTVHARAMADLGLSSQTMLPMTSRGTLIDVGGWKSAGVSNSYDRQTQGSIYPMAKVHDDGFIGCTWTNEDNPPLDGFDNPICFRGVGYSYSTDGGATWSWSNPDNPEYQENRVGGIPLYWPSYAQWGTNGEVILARSADTYEYNGMQILNGLVLLTRENKGQGEWNINVVPYPDGYAPGTEAVLAWARMTTGGPNHEYIHILSPMRTPVTGDSKHPTYYYRTQDGGVTWDHKAELLTELTNHDLGENPSFTDNMDIVARDNTVACSFIRWGFSAYMVKSSDNGDSWQHTTVFDSPVGFDMDVADFADTIFAPTLGGGIAIDREGMVHLAFGLVQTKNGDDGGLSYWPYIGCQFLTYWNEDMGTWDDRDFNINVIDDLMWDGNCLDWDLSDREAGEWYVVSTVPEKPIIGYPIPLRDSNIAIIDDNVVSDWATLSYGDAGCFSFAQMTFDNNDVLHLAYLGLLDDGAKGSYWLRHPFYTTTPDKGETWTETEYLVNFVGVIDQEFAYLTMAGISPEDKLFLMAQTDPLPGTKEPYVNSSSEHGEVANNYTFFYIPDVPQIPPPVGIDPVDYTPLTMQLFPNPASGQVKVAFEGKGNITIYNMLGQTVYHVENVENQKDIPLNMASGVYFVTVRSGNATATQKLVVK
ncbi:MAG: T9SS type A sorting domain-containing protein [Bacteroidales bacterium]|nr:T9SS type A sorting domain-containing protein [Bacteroidales bacterium]